jgi:hypothetical protein
LLVVGRELEREKVLILGLVEKLLVPGLMKVVLVSEQLELPLVRLLRVLGQVPCTVDQILHVFVQNLHLLAQLVGVLDQAL